MVTSKQKFIRGLLHFPAGLFCVFATWFNPMLGLIFFLGFCCYEIIEDWRIKDRSYVDVYGFLIGLAVGTVTLFILREVCYAIIA